MAPKDAKGGKKKDDKNMADKFKADLDVKKVYDNLKNAKCNTQAVDLFIKRLHENYQNIKSLEQTDVPTIPLFVHDRMDFETVATVFNAFDGPNYPWLREISLCHCQIGDDGVMVIADFIKGYLPKPEKNPYGIEVLELPQNNITAKGAAYLGRLLAQNESIKVLNLDFNPLEDDGIGLIGDGMKWNSTVEKMSVQYCDIGPEGGELLAKFIVRSSSVQDLCVRGNPLGPHGITQIARSLAKNAYLVRLDIADTSFGIDIEAIEALRDGIEGNETLTNVDLNYNSLVPAGAQLLLEMLKEKKNLIKFDICERIDAQTFKEFIKACLDNEKEMKKAAKAKKGKPKPAEEPPGAGVPGEAIPPPPPDAQAAAAAMP